MDYWKGAIVIDRCTNMEWWSVASAKSLQGPAGETSTKCTASRRRQVAPIDGHYRIDYQLMPGNPPQYDAHNQSKYSGKPLWPPSRPTPE